MFNQDQENPVVKNSFRTSKPMTLEMKAKLTNFANFSSSEAMLREKEEQEKNHQSEVTIKQEDVDLVEIAPLKKETIWMKIRGFIASLLK